MPDSLSGIDWDRIDCAGLCRRLRERIAVMAVFTPDVFNCAVSADDILHEAFVVVLSSPNRFVWNPAAEASLEVALEKFIFWHHKTQIHRPFAKETKNQPKNSVFIRYGTVR